MTSPTLRALTVRQPWADKIAHDTKRVENRSWPLPAKHHGARVLIHAGKTGDRQAIGRGIMPGPDVRGAVIAVATLTDCHYDRFDEIRKPCCPDWGEPWVFHWLLDDVQALKAPVPCRGSQGFWTPPRDVLDAVLAQVGATA